MITFPISSGNIVLIRNLGRDVFWEGGGPIDLKCIVSLDRFSNVYWIKDNSSVWSLNNEFLIDLSPNHAISQGIGRSDKKWVRLYIETAQRKHSGSYKCVAEDPHANEQVESEVKIHVNYAPQQNYPQCRIEVNRQLDVPQLTCLSEPGSPEVILEWTIDGKNGTNLPSRKLLEDNILKQIVHFGDVPSPEGPTVVICSMFLEHYGALRSCQIDVSEMYNFNTSFEINPPPTNEVMLGQTYNGTCSSSLSLAHFMVTLQLPNRTPHQMLTRQIDDGVAVQIDEITLEYDGAVLSCQIGWGFLYGRTKITQITVSQVDTTKVPTGTSIDRTSNIISHRHQLTSKTTSKATDKRLAEGLNLHATRSSESPNTMADGNELSQSPHHQIKSTYATRLSTLRGTSPLNKYETPIISNSYDKLSTRSPLILTDGDNGIQPTKYSPSSDSTEYIPISNPSSSPTGNHHITSQLALNPVRPDIPLESLNDISSKHDILLYALLIISGLITSILIIALTSACVLGMCYFRKRQHNPKAVVT